MRSEIAYIITAKENDMKLARLVTALIVAVVFVTASTAQKKEEPKNLLVGNWVCEDDGTKVEIRPNGTLTIDGTEYAYKLKNSVINVVGEDGAMAIPFQLEGDTLTVSVEGREMVYTRVKAGAKSGVQGSSGFGTYDHQVAGVMQALVGKWCYMSSLTGSNSYMSSRCFVLNANGTYEYSAESSTSGAAGSTAGQSYDSGRW